MLTKFVIRSLFKIIIDKLKHKYEFSIEYYNTFIILSIKTSAMQYIFYNYSTNVLNVYNIKGKFKIMNLGDSDLVNNIISHFDSSSDINDG